MQKYFCWQRPHWPEYGAELLYVLASSLGALLAVGLFRLLNGVGIHDVLTAKLFHAPRYRCIFKHVNAPQVNTDQDGRLVAPRERD